MKKNEIDFRTSLEKARDEKYMQMGEHFKELVKMPFATPTRVFRYLAKEHNTTFLTVRKNLIRLGYYTPQNGN